jgi:hypothetical protein
MGIPVADAANAAATIGLTAATIAVGQATTGQEIAVQTTIAATEQAQEGKNFAQKLAEYGKDQASFLQIMAFKASELLKRISHFMAKMAQKRAAFMIKMSAWTARFAKMMAMIAKFMPIIKVMLIIIMVFTNFLQYVIMLIAALFISLLLVIYKILSIPGIIYIPTAIYWFLFDFVPFVIYFILYMGILLFITLLCAIISFINVVIPGSMNSLLFCENGPNSWYQTVNWHFENKYDRGLFCSKPCKSGYRPDATGSFCERNDKKAADFCPQAQVMRIWSGYNRSDKKYAYVDFDDQANMKYRMSMPKEREEMIKAYFVKRKKFFEACEDKMNPYNNITLDICSNLDAIEKRGLYDLKKADINKLKKVCNQAFCTPGNSYPFCAALANTSKSDDDILLKLLVKFGIGLIVFLVIFITLVQIVQEF